MRTKIGYFVLTVCVMAALVQAAEITTVWNPAANPSYDPNTASAMWTDAANWTGTVPEGGPNSNEKGDSDYYKVVFNVAGAKECVLDAKRTAGHLVMGDWGYGSVLRLVDGAELHAGCKQGILPDGTGEKVWTAVGWGADATLIVEKGAYMTTYDHLWVCLPNNTNNPYYGTVVIDGGTLYVQQMFGLNWDNQANSYAQCTVKSGTLKLAQFVSQSIRANSNLDIETGKVVMSGDRTGAVNPMVADGRITAFKTAKFDKPGTVTVFRNFSTDTTDLTAIHPVQPAPYLDETIQIGDITLEWNNWDPNRVGDSVLVDVWFGTDPNKLGTSYTKVVAGADVTGLARSSFVVNAPLVGTYYWQVDTSNGASTVQEGDVFSFEATNDLPPVVDAGLGFISWIGEPVSLNATVTDEAMPTLTWTSEPAENVSFSDAGVEDPTVTFAATGTYTLTLTANDGFNAPVSDTTVVTVYADACSAARDGTNNRPATDILVDCTVDINDFAELAADWLIDYALTAPINN